MRLPRKPRITPAGAWRTLREDVVSCAQIATLSGNDFTSLIDGPSQLGIVGGAVYDAVMARAAELAPVDRLVTLNEAHLRRVWPQGAGRIGSPSALTPTFPNP